MFLLLYWPTYADAGTDNLYSLFHCARSALLQPELLVQQGLRQPIDTAGTLEVTDPTKSQDLYNQAQQLLVDQAPGWLPIDTEQTYAMNAQVQGFMYNLNYPFSFFYACLCPDRERHRPSARAGLADGWRTAWAVACELVVPVPHPDHEETCANPVRDHPARERGRRLLGVSIITFLLARVIPSNPAAHTSGRTPDPTNRPRGTRTRPGPALADPVPELHGRRAARRLRDLHRYETAGAARDLARLPTRSNSSSRHDPRHPGGTDDGRRRARWRGGSPDSCSAACRCSGSRSPRFGWV